MLDPDKDAVNEISLASTLILPEPMLSLLPGFEQHGAKHDQGNDQDDDEFAKAKHDLADLRLVRYGGRYEAREFVVR